MLNETNVEKYLSRVTARNPEVSLSFLKELQQSHVTMFSFNNLAVLLHENLSLDSQILFERIIENKRGGYCFEHNKLFCEVLRHLGFACEIVLARVLPNRDADVPRTHRITRVSLAGNEYVVDVGFGSLCSRAPLLLDSDEPQDQGDAVYRIIEPDAGQYVLQMGKDGGWSTLYAFDRNLYTEADCLCGHHYSSTYPDAVFVNNLVVTLKSDGDIRSLRNGSFHHTAGGVNTITSISSSAELGRILAQEFGIELAPDQLSMLYEGYCE